MPQSIERMVEERHGHSQFRGDLDPDWPCRYRRHDRRCFKVPSQRRCGQVCETEEVETTAQDHGGQTVQRGPVPGDLGLVDGEMRGDWTLEALLGEVFLGCLGGDLVCCCVSVRNPLASSETCIVRFARK